MSRYIVNTDAFVIVDSTICACLPTECGKGKGVTPLKAHLSPLVAVECDGVLLDLHSDGHRVAFNKTFESLGLECANWTDRVYYDLLRSADGTEEGLVRLFFDTVGWPSTVATEDYKSLVLQVVKMKKEELRKLFGKGEISLRSGALKFIDEVLESEATLAVLTCTQSDQKDGIWELLSPLLADRKLRMQPIKWPDTPISDQTISKHIQETKKKEAKAFISSFNSRNREKQTKVTIDPSLLLPNSQSIDPTFFLTMAASMSSSLNKTVIVGAHNSILQSAAASGAVCVAVPSGLSHRRPFPAAEIVFDGFGPGGGITWKQLEKLINQRKQHI